jgi:hypothetical protein
MLLRVVGAVVLALVVPPAQVQAGDIPAIVEAVQGLLTQRFTGLAVEFRGTQHNGRKGGQEVVCGLVKAGDDPDFRPFIGDASGVEVIEGAGHLAKFGAELWQKYCPDAVPEIRPSRKDQAAMDKGQEAVRYRLKDPESSRFRAVGVYWEKDGTAYTCGEVNARNSMGGYVGFARFLTNGTPARTMFEGDSDFDYQWTRYCR